MLPEEASVLGEWTRQLNLGSNSVCLNVGSSTREFREETQPFIHQEILKPLAESGCRVVNCDMKEDDGVDEVGDLLNQEFQKHLTSYKADLVICSNLLEHLSDPASFARACGAIVKPGGHFLFSVPRSFPYHPDPLDTMFRPSPDEIAALLPGWYVVAAQELVAGSYRHELLAAPFPARALARQVIRSLLPFYRPAQWKPAAHKLLWLFRPYRVSLIMLRKPAQG